MNEMYQLVGGYRGQAVAAAEGLPVVCTPSAGALADSRRRKVIAMSVALALTSPAALAQTSLGQAIDGTGPGLEVCKDTNPYGINNADCTLQTDFGTTSGFGLFAQFGQGWGNSQPAFVVGTQNGDLVLKGSNGITMRNQVRMSNNSIAELAPGVADTDAVNVSQLKGAVSSLGGGASVSADGTVTAPSYNVGKKVVSNVGDAISNIDSRVTSLGDTLNSLNNGGGIKYFRANSTLAEAMATGTESVAIGPNARASASDSIALGNGAIADRANTVSVGSGKLKRQIVNVAAGVADTDAVNIKQLKDAGFSFNEGTVSARGITYVPGSVEAGAPRVELAQGTGNSRYFADINGDGIGEREAPLPNGTRISNVANGVQDTDAVNLGQLRDLSNAAFDSRKPVFAPVASAPVRPTLRMSAAATTAMTTPMSAAGSGVDSASRQRTTAMKQANYYLKVNGRGDAVGSTAPTDDASASGIGSIAIGSDSASSADNGIAFGTLARTTAKDAVALGAGSVADQDNTVSVGSAQANSYAAYANDGVSKTRLTSAANTRRIVNMAAGTGATDAVNVGQLRQVAQAMGGGADLNPDGSFKAPSYNLAGGSYSNVGDALSGLDGRMTENSTRLAQLGSQLKGGGGLVQQDATRRDIGVALNTDGSRVNFAGTAGDRTLAGVARGTADNDGVNVSQLKGVMDSLGGGAKVNADGTVSGPTYSINGTRATSIADAIAKLGAQVGNTTAGLVQQDAGSGQITVAQSSDGTQVNFAGSQGARVLTGVASGAISQTSDQAVNGAQLHASTTSLANALGGGAKVNPDGSIVAPTYVVGGTTVRNAGDAIRNIDTRVSNNSAAIQALATGGGVKYLSVKSAAAAATATGAEAVAVGPQASATGAASVAIGNGAQASADNSVALGAGSVATKANSVSVGNTGKERSISNVAAGTDDTDAVNVSQLKQSQQGSARYDSQAGGQGTDYTSLSLGGPAGKTTTTVRNVRAGVADTDAVNVGQLQAGMGRTLDKARAYTDGRIQQVQEDAWVARREARGGTAAAMAMAGMPQAYLPGRSMLAAAASSFQGESALAVGLSGVSESGRYVYKAQTSANTRGDFGVTVGAGLQW